MRPKINLQLFFGVSNVEDTTKGEKIISLAIARFKFHIITLSHIILQKCIFLDSTLYTRFFCQNSNHRIRLNKAYSIELITSNHHSAICPEFQSKKVIGQKHCLGCVHIEITEIIMQENFKRGSQKNRLQTL